MLLKAFNSGENDFSYKLMHLVCSFYNLIYLLNFLQCLKLNVNYFYAKQERLPISNITSLTKTTTIFKALRKTTVAPQSINRK